MRKRCGIRKTWKTILWITAMLIVIITTVMWYRVISFDSDNVCVDYKETDKQVYLEGTEITDSNDSWQTGIQQSEDPEDFICYTGTTCPINVVNQNSFDVMDWILTLHIQEECYLSGFWCGSVTVYQNRDGQTIETKVGNQAVSVSTLGGVDRNPYTDNMMIHLLPGDYLEYFPSAKEKEDVINAKTAVGIGFIFYYEESLDLSQWELSYKNDMKMRDLPAFKIIIIFICLWTLSLILYHLLSVMEKRMREQMSNKIRTLSIMMDLHIEAYMVDIAGNTAHLIKGDESKTLLQLAEEGAQDSINDRIASCCQEDYRDELTAFLNLTDVMQRMKDTSSISFEFFAENLNWYAIRIFKVDEEAGQIVLTLQDISEEKKILSQIEERVQMAEYKQNVSGSFLGTVSFALNDIASKISLDSKEILNQSLDENVKNLADRISMNVRHMNLIQNTMLDMYEIECKRLSLNNRLYDIFEMVREIKHMLEPFSLGRDYDFTVDIDKNIPAKLYGDSDRIEQIIVIILFSSLLMTQKGFVKFTVFGKRHEKEEELIFTIKDSGQGFTEEQIREIHDFINGASIETFDNASLVYLKIINGILKAMDSELKMVSVLNEGSDFYFTIRQNIVDNTDSEE